jgi:4-hydroxy-2-oxoheptanedioate aldolase
MLKINFLKEKLQAGKTVLGTWSVIPSPVVADVIAAAGVDFLIIDSEHGPINFETAQNMVMACESRGVSPVMRLWGVNEGEILKALDIGAHCVQIPNVTCRAEIEAVVRMAKYPPAGNRGFSPFTRAGAYTHENAARLTASANENTLICVHIEGKAAIDNISEFLAIKELDIIFIGLFDISKSLGIPGQVNDPRVQQILADLSARIVKAGKYPGTIATDAAQLEKFMAAGVKYITYSVDCEMLGRSYKKAVLEFQAITGKGAR